MNKLTYTMNNETSLATEVGRDLGVQVDQELSFQPQVTTPSSTDLAYRKSGSLMYKCLVCE